MRPNDYIEYSDVMSLSDTEFESLLSYIKIIGFHVLRSSQERDERHSNCVLLLDDECVLVCFPMKWLSDDKIRIPLEEVKRMAALGMVV